ncbi:ATP-dependent helicase [Microtetraspora sp. NBRC 13810]|uniref:ATP-dependent helicase HrpB n=1 Tax=Microtetraspora sp. NBRC 13810 TaxID=3030990 RepID=UPI0024A4DEEE|nr:ATP-dependent helicase HrpB [Microtetraspora sp. NBRC 13810]GLW12714.1 ATP-dependent helicase [Microtetraspora sp. NBRC 13810]
MSAPPELPITEVLPELLRELARCGSAVLTAPPGTGKTTVVPPALADAGMRVLVAEPRRLAVRAAARRMAALTGGRVGERVGFTVRGERRAGPDTRVEVVTTGVLLQRLQRDQELAGVDVVMLDECHERHLDADLALAFLLDVRDTLRPDLRLIVTSATTDAGPWSRLLGGAGGPPAPVVRATGTMHPVETVWAPPAGPLPPPHGTRVDPAFLAHVAQVVERALAERDGDVLCFLPGVGEIGRVAGLLRTGPDVEILQVHGQAPAHVQDAVLTAGSARRVVLATSVAESSLTVPGVRVVVDSGLAREPRTDHARGLGSLVTVRASRASAGQRAGRAGREAPGAVYRCWPEAEHARLPEYAQPEIAVADLTGFALQAACWGAPDATGLALLTPPPPGAMSAATAVLRSLGALRPAGPDGAAPRPPGVTGQGRRMAGAGVHPRLARALLDAGPGAAEVVALLSEQLPRDAGDDLVEILRAVRRGGRDGGMGGFAARWRQEAKRLAVPGERGAAAMSDDALAGLVVALAFPERVARRRGGGYLMASGTRAQTGPGSRLGDAEWVAVAIADRPSGSAAARVRQAVVIDEDTARRAMTPVKETEVGWRVPPGARRGDVSARTVERLGAIELSSAPLRDPDPALLREALLYGLRTENVLTWTREAVALRERLAFCHRAMGDPWPAMDDLIALADRWLEPELSRARRRADLERLDVAGCLRRLVPWHARLDAVAPERIEVPTGSRIRVDYSGEQPVLAVKLQELFGWEDTPRIAGVPLLIHLLSPAGRPTAVTADLASFWREGYHAVRADLRGRYPRHPWPENPLTASPTRRANPHR